MAAHAYLLTFRFEKENEQKGSFEIIVNADTISSAEKKARKKIRKFQDERSFFASGTIIILLDIIRIDDPKDGLIMNLTRRVKGGSVFFSSLPEPGNQAESWAVSMPDQPDLFLEIE